VGAGGRGRLRYRGQQTHFFAIRKLGTFIARVHREFTDAGLEKIISNFHAWRSLPSAIPVRRRPCEGGCHLASKLPTPGSRLPAYATLPSFCKSATLRGTLLPKLLSGELTISEIGCPDALPSEITKPE
jgi:hypothetical protein